MLQLAKQNVFVFRPTVAVEELETEIESSRKQIVQLSGRRRGVADRRAGRSCF